MAGLAASGTPLKRAREEVFSAKGLGGAVAARVQWRGRIPTTIWTAGGGAGEGARERSPWMCAQEDPLELWGFGPPVDWGARPRDNTTAITVNYVFSTIVGSHTPQLRNRVREKYTRKAAVYYRLDYSLDITPLAPPESPRGPSVHQGHQRRGRGEWAHVDSGAAPTNWLQPECRRGRRASPARREQLLVL